MQYSPAQMNKLMWGVPLQRKTIPYLIQSLLYSRQLKMND